MTRTKATREHKQEFKNTIELLLAADRRTFDVAEWTVFFDALHDIPAPLLKRAVLTMARTQRRFPFRPGDIREAAERCRQELLKAEPWRPCGDCESLNGFIEITDDAGVKRLKKCDCIKSYNDRILGSGIPVQPLLYLGDGDEANA